MTSLLSKVFEQPSKLSPKEQDRLAARPVEEMADEQRGQWAFAKSRDMLARLADELLAERQAGKTEVLDPDDLFATYRQESK